MEHIDAGQWFDPVPGYLNTAAVGLPCRATLTELDRRLAEWREGRCDPPSFDADVARARSAYARIVGVDASRVGVIGPGLGRGGDGGGFAGRRCRSVLCAEEDFTSVLFPFLADPRLSVRTVPLDRLVNSIDDGVDLVAVSAVQSADGRVIDLDALARLAASAGARTLLDLTQSAGWLPIDAGVSTSPSATPTSGCARRGASGS
jgi:hypothetical protein